MRHAACTIRLSLSGPCGMDGEPQAEHGLCEEAAAGVIPHAGHAERPLPDNALRSCAAAASAPCLRVHSLVASTVSVGPSASSTGTSRASTVNQPIA